VKITVAGFKGENRALHPLDLPAVVGTRSLNQDPSRGDLRPLQLPLTVASVPPGRQTIYRMGRDVPNSVQYWLSWPSVVHAVRGFNPDDTTEKTYYTGDGFPKWTDNTRALASAPYPTAWRQLGVPAPAAACLLSAAGGVATAKEVRFYTYTYVTDAGEESAPAPVSQALTCKTDDVVQIFSIASPPAGSFTINRLRLYRTQADTAGNAEFFFLREIPAGQGATSDASLPLGEVMPSIDWLVPPANLANLTGLWNGIMAGISGGAVRFCEAYKPYAWPIAYEVIPPDATPVALGRYGQNLLVLTTGKPIRVTGGTPDAMDSQPLEIAEACIAPRSVVSFGHGVAWACPDGLAYFGDGGARMLTAGLMTRKDWQAINPSSLVAGIYEGGYLGFYTVGGVTKGFLIDPLNPTGLFFNDVPGSALFFDELQDQLFLLDGVNIKKWNAGALMAAGFTSKEHRVPRPLNFGCAEVIADGYPVTFKLYADGVLKHTQAVASADPFRLPSGFMGQRWQIALDTPGSAIQGAAIAQSMQELADV
jgi:hypothetical protein